MKDELMFDTMIGLLKELKAYQFFLDWIKDKAGPEAQGLEKVLEDFRSEIASEPDLENKIRAVAASALQAGDKNLHSALILAFEQWKPTGKVN